MPRQRPPEPPPVDDAGDGEPTDAASAAAAGPPEVMTLPDLARYLRFSEQHVRKLADEGRLGGWKLGSAWRFLKTDIDRRLLGGEG